MKTKKLSAQDRDFLSVVARATFANPFGEERDRLDRQLVPDAASEEDVVEAVVARVTAQVERLREAGLSSLQAFDERDRQLIRPLYMFLVYHRYRREFDDFISRQAQEGEKPLRPQFASDVLRELAGYGFQRQDGIRLFAFFYQVRRAFYFIDQALVGKSGSVRRLRMDLWNNIFTHRVEWFERHLWNRMEDFSTLLLGETGTGKGAAAAAIGRSGFIPYDETRGTFTESFARNFISINLSQYPESLLESELFGHRKGAFTGAIDNHDGIFSRCTPHGSIFLDEIGDTSLQVQIKLLQVLQERQFAPVGSHGKTRFNGRVIAATNRPLDELRREGLFRDDFYYRLCSDTILLPPLRARIAEDPEELHLLVSHLVKRMVGEGAPEVTAFVLEILARDVDRHYEWPGNVRELEQAVRRIFVTGSYRTQQRPVPADLLDRLAQGAADGTLDAAMLLSLYCRHLYAKSGNFEEVARRTNLDRRTVRKYVAQEE